PLARYSATNGALVSGFPIAELHHLMGHDRSLCSHTPLADTRLLRPMIFSGAFADGATRVCLIGLIDRKSHDHGRHSGKSPELLGREVIRTIQVSLANEKNLPPDSIRSEAQRLPIILVPRKLAPWLRPRGRHAGGTDVLSAIAERVSPRAYMESPAY
ncbi:hypothetical protein NKJ88_32395, partial [Mesorhizobium sp. M0016]